MNGLMVSCPVDQTSIFSLNPQRKLRSEVVPAVEAVRSFVQQSADLLSECLGAGALTMGMVQGSGFCGAVLASSKTKPSRVLISPEELTASMALKLLQSDCDE
jgi:hypothetical protein